MHSLIHYVLQELTKKIDWRAMLKKILFWPPHLVSMLSLSESSLDDFLEFAVPPVESFLLRASSNFRDFSDQRGGSSMPCGKREDSMQLKNWRRWPPAGNCNGWCWVPSMLTRTTVHSRSPPPHGSGYGQELIVANLLRQNAGAYVIKYQTCRLCGQEKYRLLIGFHYKMIKFWM